MNIIRLIIIVLLLPLSNATSETSVAENWKNGIVETSVKVSFLIVMSTPSYKEALAFTEKISPKLGIPINLRGLIYDPENGLTLTPEECAKDELYPYPCYLARGRFDSGRYLSIERSDAYSSFKPGLFVVLVQSGSVNNLRTQLPIIRKVVPDAYIKINEVYIGCMH